MYAQVCMRVCSGMYVHAEEEEALCPPVQRVNYYVEFEARILRTGEDPSAYK